MYDSGWRFNQIICIARGGLRVGDVLSRIYEVPLAILSTHSYTAEGGTIRGQLVIAEHMTMTAPRLGDRVLLVDDMVDSGHTLEAVFKTLPTRFPHITDIRSAVEAVRALAGRVPVIGFCAAPFTLASYMIEGGASRNFIRTKRMMYADETLWRRLMGKLVDVLGAFAVSRALPPSYTRMGSNPAPHSCTTSPAVNLSRRLTVTAAPTLGCPANGNSVSGVKMRAR